MSLPLDRFKESPSVSFFYKITRRQSVAFNYSDFNKKIKSLVIDLSEEIVQKSLDDIFHEGLLITNEKSSIIKSTDIFNEEMILNIQNIFNADSRIKTTTLIFKIDSSEIFLVGARLNILNSKMFNEIELDSLAERIGVSRPKVEFNICFQEALCKVKNSNNKEFIFRDSFTKKYLVKISS